MKKSQNELWKIRKIIQVKREVSKDKNLISVPLGRFTQETNLKPDEVVDALQTLQDGERALTVKTLWRKKPRNTQEQMLMQTFLYNNPIKDDGRFLFSAAYKFNEEDEIVCEINEKVFDKQYQKNQEEIGADDVEYEADKILYQITYINREVRLNNIVLAKPNFDSENDVVFEYIFNNPNKKITRKEVESVLKRPTVKKFEQIIRDLGFKGQLKAMFFPNVSIGAIQFINPITKEYLDKNSLSPLKPNDF